MWDNFGQQLYDNIIKEGRLGLYWDGLKNTLYLTLGAAVIGIILGSLVAIAKVYLKNKKKPGSPLRRFLDKLRYIVLPQAIKNILPALANEAITLLKETAIVGYAAQQDITYVATLIRSRTYSPVPLLFIALVYLILVLLMTYGTRKLERRLARSDRS